MSDNNNIAFSTLMGNRIRFAELSSPVLTSVGDGDLIDVVADENQEDVYVNLFDRDQVPPILNWVQQYRLIGRSGNSWAMAMLFLLPERK